MVSAIKQDRPAWDKRTWRLAAIFSLVIGGLILVGTVGPFGSHPEGSAKDVMPAVAVLLSLFIFPPVLSGIAHRRTLLWAYLPLLALIGWIFAAAIVDAI